MDKPKPKSHNILFFLLFLIAFLERTAFDLGPNFELLTTVVVLASFFLSTKKTLWLTFLVLALSDRLIGNTKIFLFTWSGFLIPAYFLPKLFSILNLKYKGPGLKTLILTGSGISSNLFFYLFTNFGVWLLDAWGMYERNTIGLIKCYINGLPFLKNQMVSSLIFIPMGLFIIEKSYKFAFRELRVKGFNFKKTSANR